MGPCGSATADAADGLALRLPATGLVTLRVGTEGWAFQVEQKDCDFWEAGIDRTRHSEIYFM